MKVLIDGYNLQLEHGTGVATYAQGLSHLLKGKGHEVDVLYGRSVSGTRNELLQEVEFFDRPPKRRRSRLARLREAVALSSGFRTAKPTAVPQSGAVLTAGLDGRLASYDRLWNQNRLFETAHARHHLTGGFVNVSNHELKVNVAHWTYPLPMRMPGVPNVYTVHDLVPIRLPYATLDRKADYIGILQTIAHTADLIVTVSEASRRDIVELLGVEEKRVVNTYQPALIPDAYLETSEQELARSLRGFFDLETQGYILAYGAVEPKKNFGRLIEAYLSSDLDIPLVLAGPDGWLARKELSLLKNNQHGTRRVRRVGYVPFHQLIHLIRGARCVAFPSLYEGFGLPITEAMACGTPVVTSNFGATAEIAGDAAELVDPYDVASIRDAVTKVCVDADRRAELIEKGHVQRQRYSAEACGQRLAKAYNAIGLSTASPT